MKYDEYSKKVERFIGESMDFVDLEKPESAYERILKVHEAASMVSIGILISSVQKEDFKSEFKKFLNIAAAKASSMEKMYGQYEAKIKELEEKQNVD